MILLERTPSREQLDSALDDDRRDGSRVKVLKQARITSLAGVPQTEIATVIDLTREGMYFTARAPQFTVGNEVRLKFPDTGSECNCLTVRVEELPDGRQGIGVRILDW